MCPAATTDDIVTWGMECPDCIYTRATMRGGESYRLFGNRGTARYVGLQTMNGIVSTANELVDELEVDADGNFEVVLSAEEHDGNWMPIEGDHPTLTVRHFFYDWNTEVPSSLHIERLGNAVEAKHVTVEPDVAVSRQLVALGDFVHDNLQFFLQFGGAAPPNGFLPPIDRTAIGAAAENRPVIGRWEPLPRRRSDSRSNPSRASIGVIRSATHGGRRSITGAPIQPERRSGRRGFRRAGASGAVRARPRRRELARHRGLQQRRDDPSLRAHHDGTDAENPPGDVRRHRVGAARRDQDGHSGRAPRRPSGATARRPRKVRTVTFSADELEDGAREATGLADFGSPYYREGLERTIEALNTQADLNDIGKVIQHATISNALIQRLKIEDTYARHPEIDDEVVGGPVFVIGLPRTGTTALSQLVAADPQFPSLRMWSRRPRPRRRRPQPSTPIPGSRRPKRAWKCSTTCSR